MPVSENDVSNHLPMPLLPTQFFMLMPWLQGSITRRPLQRKSKITLLAHGFPIKYESLSYQMANSNGSRRLDEEMRS